VIDIDERFRNAVEHYWQARSAQKTKNIEGGRIDPGTRGAVVGGAQMGALEVLVTDIFVEAGLDKLHVRTRTALELPGYFRPEKKWDLLIISNGQLVAAMEFKSQVGPSFGNNFNNRTEEAIGSATDIWTAYREGRLGNGPRPMLGYFFLLEDCEAVHKPVKNAEPYFKVDDEFKGASYSTRYQVFIRRMLRERLYDAACLTLSSSSSPNNITHPAEDLSFRRFVATLNGVAAAFAYPR
jgi:hypothetical protein